jgi:argininosuccinate lyase
MVEEVFQEGYRALDLLHDLLGNVTFDVAVLERRARDGFASVTEVADTLVREAGLPFRQAHHVVAEFVTALRAEGKTLPAASLADLDAAAVKVVGKPTGLSADSYQKATDPRVFIERRAIIGGPAPQEVRRAIKEAHASVAMARKAVTDRRADLETARSRMLAEAGALVQAQVQT